MKLPLVSSLVCMSLAVGCANRQVSTPPRPPAGVAIVEEPGAPGFSGKMRTTFAAALSDELYDDETVTRGNDFTLRWRAAEVDEGNRALRYFVGFGAGRGVLRLQGTLTDRKGRVLATRAIGDSQTIGLFGGAFSEAVEGAATDLAEFAREELERHR